jgi:hypothetical protein
MRRTLGRALTHALNHGVRDVTRLAERAASIATDPLRVEGSVVEPE